MADKIDIPSFQIAASKMRADGNAYFKLFEKHVPRNLDMNNVVLLYKLDNLSCICKIINMNIKAHYVVVSNDAVNTALQVVLDKSIDVEYIKEFDFKETDMKFDCIIMNPPYQKNLHLKVLAEAIKHLKDDESKVINLSPVRWLQDPLVEYKKTCDYKRFENSVSKHIFELNIIKQQYENMLFSAEINTDLAIYVCNNKGGYDYKNEYTKTTNVKIFNEIKKFYKKYPVLSLYNENEKKYFVAIKAITNPYRKTAFNICSNIGIVYCGKCENGKHYKDAMYKSKTFSENRELRGIYFNSFNEAKNFINSTLTATYKYFCSIVIRDVHVHPEFLPWLGDAINPRTGMKGYTGEWTDEDLVLYFGITPEEQKTIEKTMEKYR